MRAAIVHYWLVNRRGGEAVLDAIAQLLPEADIFTLFCDRAALSPVLQGRRIVTSFLDPLQRYHRALLPLMPMALESLDLRGYDLVISSESGPAKGVLAPSGARHICYCHTPMRYLWELYPDYLYSWTRSRFRRAMIAPVANYLRVWDAVSALRVDEFIANSENTLRRIRRCYRREAQVIYPPVDIESFFWREPEDYYLTVSELVAYKRIDLAVRAFSASGRRLRVVGDGPAFKELKRQAAANVEFCGRVTASELRELYSRCRAFVMPGEEDFGITPIEAMASGKPVIALGRGGALETVPAGEVEGAILFERADVESLDDAIGCFERIQAHVSPSALQASARRFSKQEFDRKFKSVLENPPHHEPVPPKTTGPVLSRMRT